MATKKTERRDAFARKELNELIAALDDRKNLINGIAHDVKGTPSAAKFKQSAEISKRLHAEFTRI